MLTDQNLITVDSEKNRAKTHSVISNVRTRTNRHQMQMLILNQLRLKTRLFSNTDVFKAKSLSKKKKRDTTTNWKSHQENFDSQTKLRLTKTQQ
jgi:hypothetical protein